MSISYLKSANILRTKNAELSIAISVANVNRHFKSKGDKDENSQNSEGDGIDSFYNQRLCHNWVGGIFFKGDA